MKKRIRFEEVQISQICETEYDERIMKVEMVRIKTDKQNNFRNAVNLFTGKLLSIDTSQWVWVDDFDVPRHSFSL